MNRSNAVAKSCAGYDDQELTVIFIENTNSKHEKFKIDKANLIADERSGDNPSTIGQAYRSASRYTLNEAKSRVTTKEATTLLDKDRSSDKKKAGEKQQQKPATVSNKKTTEKNISSKGNKYPYTTCAVLGLPDGHSHFPNNCPHKDEIIKVLASSSGSVTTMMAVGFEPICSYPGVSPMVCGNAETIRGTVMSLVHKLTKAEVVLDNGSTINLFDNSSHEHCAPLNVSGVGCRHLNYPVRYLPRENLGGLQVASSKPQAAFITVD